MRTALLFLSLATPVLAQESRPTMEAPDPTQEGSRVKLERLWTFIQQRYDKDGNGQVTMAEYARGEVQFANYDVDGDGVLTQKDFPDEAWYNGFGPGVAQEADRDRNRTVTAEEWQTFLDGLALEDDGSIDVAALAESLPEPRMRHHRHRRGRRFGSADGGDEGDRPTREEALATALDTDGDGTVTKADLQAIFDALDADADGAISSEEKPQRPRPMGRRARRAGKGLFRLADADESLRGNRLRRLPCQFGE